MSGAEIALVCREAGLKALSAQIETEDLAAIQVSQIDLTEALTEVKARGKPNNNSLFK